MSRRSSNGRFRCEWGYTIIEVVIATAITAAIAGVVLGMLDPAHGMHQAQPETADLHQRLRVAVESLRRDLIAAGAGTHLAPAAGPLTTALPPVMPYRAGETHNDPANGVYYRNDAISIMYVPATTAQAGIADATPLGAADLRVNAQFNCGPLAHDALCGFDAGMHTLIFDPSGAWDAMTVTQIDATTLDLNHRRGRPPHDYHNDAAIAQIEMHTYYLDVDARARTYQLRHDDGFGVDLPMVDDVVGLEFEYYGDPAPPRLLTGVVLSDPGFERPVTTYGPTPPASGVDRLSDAWPAGENCTFAFVDGDHVPRLPVMAATSAPVPLPPAILQDGPWCPDALSTDRFDADLLRVRRVRVKLRVQVGNAVLRGPAGVLFAHGGSAASGYRLVPDQEIVFDVTPRNMRAGR
jgi:hypothetical protein